jgi:hypothetical protein
MEWKARGDGAHKDRKKKDIYAEFAEAVRQARASDQLRRVLRINKAGQGGAVLARKVTTETRGEGASAVTTTVTEEKLAPPDWRADAWHLARTDPKHFGRRERVELTGESGEPIKIKQIEAVEPPPKKDPEDTPVAEVEVVPPDTPPIQD